MSPRQWIFFLLFIKSQWKKWGWVGWKKSLYARKENRFCIKFPFAAVIIIISRGFIDFPRYHQTLLLSSNAFAHHRRRRWVLVILFIIDFDAKFAVVIIISVQTADISLLFLSRTFFIQFSCRHWFDWFRRSSSVWSICGDDNVVGIQEIRYVRWWCSGF